MASKEQERRRKSQAYEAEADKLRHDTITRQSL